jgi:squalene synthase HpnC
MTSGSTDARTHASPWAGASTAHYENFPVGSWLLPSRLRPAVAAIYQFARHADDVADEGDRPDQDRLAELAAMRAALDDPSQPHPAVEPLRPHWVRHALDPGLLADLLTAFERDVRIKRHANRAALLDYCRYSANPIGRLMLQLVDVRDARSADLSDSLCTALQLINFWQDVAIDWHMGRVYLPQQALAAAGLHDSDLAAAVEAGRCPPALRAVIGAEASWASALL